MPPLDLASGAVDAAQAAPRGFAYEEIGWIADLAPAIALRCGVDLESLAGGVVLVDAHRDAEPLWRLARHPNLIQPARRLLRDEVVVATTLLCLGVAFPAGLTAPGAVLATVHLDRRPCSRSPGAPHGRFGTVGFRALADAAEDEEEAGRSFRIVYAAAADCARWPRARIAEPVGEADLWPVAHLPFG